MCTYIQIFKKIFIVFILINNFYLNTENLNLQRNSVKKITIYVHGTHSKILTTLFKERMVLPLKLNNYNEVNDKCFYKSVLKNFCSETNDYALEDSYIFGWTGDLSNKSRINAAKILYENLKELTKKFKNYEITIITHSHGGNVVLNIAKQIKDNDKDFKIEKLILLACPVQEQTKHLITNKIFKKVYNIFSKFDLIQILDLQKFHSINKNKKVPFFSERLFAPSENIKQAKIKINDIGLMHIDFVFPKFIKTLSKLLTVMDLLDSNDLTNLIKIDLSSFHFKIVSKNKNEIINFPSNSKNKNNVVIFVHGSHTLSKLIVKYTNKLNVLENFKSLKPGYVTHKIANSLNQNKNCDFNLDNFYSFGWSGKININERLKAAKELYLSIKNLISDYKKNNINPKITLITHSHGGNVALNLANFINKNEEDIKVEKLILLGCPVQENTKKFIKSNMFKNIYNIYSKCDLLQVIDPQGLYNENKNKQVPLFSERIFEPLKNLKQAKIKINNKALTHLEFLSNKFMKNLDSILKKLEQLNYSDVNHLMKLTTA